MKSTRTAHEQQAYDLGVERAKNAASWIVDGNTKRELIPALLKMIDDGDPQAEDYLPARPNLSGEWANDPTPISLYREITGKDETDGNALSFETEHGLEMDALASAYEEGVSDTFEAECERILREAIS